MSRYHEQMVGDAVFWLAHDRGRPRVKPAILALALAGGLLGELFLDNKIELFDGHVVLRHELFTTGYQREQKWRAPVPPRDALSAQIFANIAADQRVDLGTWLAAIAPISVPGVTARLQRKRLLEPVAPGGAGLLLRWGARERTHRPVGDTADQVWAVLSTRLLRGDHGSEAQQEADALVVGIATVTGLLDPFLVGAKRSGYAKAEHLVDGLPDDLAQVVAQIETAIARGALLPKS